MFNNQKSFIVFKDSLEEVEMLTMEQRGLLITTALRYANECELPDLDQATAILWQTWKKNIDRNAERWEESRQRRSEAGRKGGLASRNKVKAATSNAEHSPPGQAVSVPVSVSVPVPVPVSVSVPDTPADAFPAQSPHSISFPLKNGSNYVVSGEEMQHYVKSYPMLDVPLVFQRILGWLEDNPGKQKTAEMMPRFLTYWLDGDAKKAARREADSNAGNAEATDLSALDSFGTVL